MRKLTKTCSGWLEPLLDEIARDSTNVVCPVIGRRPHFVINSSIINSYSLLPDVINDDTLAYQGGSYFAVGGFDWNLQVFTIHVIVAIISIISIIFGIPIDTCIVV